MIFNSDFLDFIECLNKAQAKYVIVGGYAVVLNGHTRTTGDVDFFVERNLENAAKVIQAINTFGFGSLGITIEDVMDDKGYIRMGIEPMRIDIFSALPGVTFEEVYNNAKLFEENSIPMKVIHINHLIQNKLAVGRPQDLADVAALKRIIKRKK